MEQQPLFNVLGDNGGYDYQQQQQQQQEHAVTICSYDDESENPPAAEEKKMKKTSGGKKKIEKMELIGDKAKRQVTFSKRRQGLFKKAKELCCMFGAQAGVVVFSEGGKTFTFDHPSHKAATLERFLKSSSTNYNYQATDNYDEDQEIEEIINNGFWWEDVQVDELELNQLEQFKASLQGFRDQLASRRQRIDFQQY